MIVKRIIKRLRWAVKIIAHKVGIRERNHYIRIPAKLPPSGLGAGAWLLHGLVWSMEPRICVEIGSAHGLSACFVGLALKQLHHGHLYAIDPHLRTDWNDDDGIETLDSMRANLRAFDVEDRVTIVRSYSEQAAQTWDKPIDMLFIDGDHSYEGVKKDWELFVPHVQPFGVVIFHDTLWDLTPDSTYYRSDMGVPRFVEELRQQGYPVITLDKHYGISLVQPTPGGRKLSGT